MNILERIDHYFYNKSKKEFMYVVVLLILVIGFIYFYYIFPFAEKYEKNAFSNYQSKLNTLNVNKVQLNVLKIQNIKLKNSLRDLKNKILSLKKQKVFYNELVSLLDFAEFNRYKWAEFVKNVLDDAKSEGLKIKLLENTIVNENSKKFKNMPKQIIVKKMSVGIDLNGNYKNFIHFLYKYESMKDLIRVEEMKIKSKTDQYVKIDLYGYEK